MEEFGIEEAAFYFCAMLSVVEGFPWSFTNEVYYGIFGAPGLP